MGARRGKMIERLEEWKASSFFFCFALLETKTNCRIFACHFFSLFSLRRLPSFSTPASLLSFPPTYELYFVFILAKHSKRNAVRERRERRAKISSALLCREQDAAREHSRVTESPLVPLRPSSSLPCFPSLPGSQSDRNKQTIFTKSQKQPL